MMTIADVSRELNIGCGLNENKIGSGRGKYIDPLDYPYGSKEAYDAWFKWIEYCGYPTIRREEDSTSLGG
jgi:hypothetical protein